MQKHSQERSQFRTELEEAELAQVAYQLYNFLPASCFSIFVYKLACAFYSGPSKITLFFKVMQENKDEKGKLIGFSYLKIIIELERRVAGNRR